MLTSDKIDFFGVDRKLTAKFRPYLTREAFERAQIFSWRAYQVVSFLARLPLSKRVGVLRRVRRNANKVVMYMLQAQMLHGMYVTNRRRASASKASPLADGSTAPRAEEVGSGALDTESVHRERAN